MLIRVLDFEATDFPDKGGRVCQVGYADVIGAGDQWEVKSGGEFLCNPGAPIPSTASAIHHIIDADVRDHYTFDALFPDERLFNKGEPAAYASHNVKAERGYLQNHGMTALAGMPWVCTYKGSMRVWPTFPGHSNQALRYELGLPVSRAIRGHTAADDAWVTAHLLVRLLGEVDLASLFEWTELPVLQHICRIGDWRGSPWEEVDSGFMGWILGKDFGEDEKFTCRHWLDKRAAEASAEREAAGDPVEATAEAAGQRGLFGEPA